jgi:phosphoribosylformimino-5-aminoimidazole carboxamide ribotide isomerase
MITIIPAMDIIDGQCVRLRQGDFARKKVYTDNPLAQAKIFEEAGLKRLHLVDLDGARRKQIVNHQVLKQVARGTGLHIDFGGGVQSTADLQLAFDCGARQITAGSIAVKNRALLEEWLSNYGPEIIILGADVRDGKIAVGGWQEQTDQPILEFLSEYVRLGFQTIICTDISRDGMLSGPSFDLYRQIKEHFPQVNLIASGGIAHVEDIHRLNDLGIDGVIIGKALYEGTITLEALQPFLC